MNAAEIIRAVKQVGGELRVTNGRLQVRRPHVRLPGVLYDALKDNKSEVFNYLTAGRELTPEEIEEHKLLCDPRQRDLSEDTSQWQYLFWRGLREGGSEDELLHALRTIRWAGARIDTGRYNTRILPGDELGTECEAIREEWLEPHAVPLAGLLSEVPTKTSFDQQVDGSQCT